MNENDLKHLLIAIVRSFKVSTTNLKLRALEDIQQEFIGMGFMASIYEGPYNIKECEDYLSINKIATATKVTTISPKISYQGKTIVKGFIKETE